MRNTAALLVEQGVAPSLLDRAEALIAEQEASALARLAPYRERLAGKRVLLNTGGVKSWSVVSALMEVGMEIVGTSVKKSTPEDKDRIRALMHDDPHMFEAMAPRDLYKLLAAGEADIMLSGGRTQFIALKAKVPWLDINQERHNAYAGYDGMVELVRQIDLAIHNPVWEEVRAAAPWDDAGQLTAAHTETPGEDASSKEPAASAYVARHRKKFADTRVDNTDPNFLAHHRKKFAGAAGDDMGEC